MMHNDRHWVIGKVESAEELARLLTKQTWCLCNGFELGGYFFLNDATHEDGAAEYAVVKKPEGDRPAIQVESITMSWCTCREALTYIRCAIAGEYDDANYAFAVHPNLQSPEEHGRCSYCA